MKICTVRSGALARAREAKVLSYSALYGNTREYIAFPAWGEHSTVHSHALTAYDYTSTTNRIVFLQKTCVLVIELFFV